MREHVAHDVSALPRYGFGTSMTTTWGTLAFCLIEGMAFALAIGTYLYLVQVNPQWPLGDTLPNHWPGTILTVLLLVSVWPNLKVAERAKEERLKAVRRGLVIMSLIGLVAVAIRFYEFSVLNIRWDQNAYGSVTWLILALHATHIITDVADTLVLTVLMFTRHTEGRRFADVEDNAFYWYFVVGSWLPLYMLLYWVPRW